MEEAEALRYLSDPREEVARAALEVLTPPARRFLRAYHRRQRLTADESDDRIQTVLARVWRRRENYRDQGIAAWYAFLKCISDRLGMDGKNSQAGTEIPVDDAQLDIPDPELPILERLLSYAEFARVADIYWAADRVLLELGTDLTREEHERRLLAAQLFYEEGATWQQVLQMLPAHPAQPDPTRAELDRWLSDVRVIRHVTYYALHFTNSELAEFLLDQPVASGEGSWCEAERHVIEWRFRHGLPLEKVAARRDCVLEREALEQLSVRLSELFPFCMVMARLLRATVARTGVDVSAGLARPGLWQRLAFQYRYREDLPLRDIAERVSPPAAQVGTDVTDGMLNVWLSGGRLLTRVAREAARASAAPA